MRYIGGRTIAAMLLVASSIWCVAAPGDGSKVFEKLTLDQAIKVALTNHPHLAEAAANIEASQARAEQAGRFPNPEAVARMESAPISSRTASQAEYVAGVSQAITLGKRRGAAKEVEEAQVNVRRREYQNAAFELTRNVRSAFATALYTSEVLNAQTNLAAATQELSRITRARVEAGDLAPVDLARVEAEEAEQRLSTMEAAATHHEAVDQLATAMGDFRAKIQSLDGNLEDSLRMSELKDVVMSLDAHPAVAGIESAVEAQRAKVRLAQAERIPDVNLDLFYRRLQGTREDAFDVGVSVPIPIFNNGRRRVREAESEVRAAEARLERTRNEIGHELHARELALQRALQAAALLKNDVLPKIESSLRTMEARYNAGDVALSELLLVRRQATETRLRYLLALREVMHSWAALKVQ